MTLSSMPYLNNIASLQSTIEKRKYQYLNLNFQILLCLQADKNWTNLLSPLLFKIITYLTVKYRQPPQKQLVHLVPVMVYLRQLV